MKRFARSVVLSLLLCLTAFATSAAAEGAWVLWGEKVTWARDATGGKTEREWQLTRALSNREECENWLAVNLTVTRERWKSADDPRIAAVDAGSDWMKVTLKTVNGISSGWTTTLPLPPGHRGPRVGRSSLSIARDQGTVTTVLNEIVLRHAVVACLQNVRALYDAASLLEASNHEPPAAALSIIGMEEFAKALVYVLAALLPDQRQTLLERSNSLRVHEVKHWVSDTLDGAHEMAREWADGVELQAGFRPSYEAVLAARLRVLLQGGLDNLLPTAGSARKYYRDLQAESEKRWPWETPPVPRGPDRKNAALYVELTSNGEVLTPDRVKENAASDVLGLEWCLDHYEDLVAIAGDDGRWRAFVLEFHSVN